MRGTLVIVMLVVGLSAGGCAGRQPEAAAPGPSGGSPTGGSPTGDGSTEIYVQVLRRYLAGGENSFPGRVFKKVYVLDRSHADAAEPAVRKGPGTPIAAGAQQEIRAAVAGVEFVADPDTVVDTQNGCAQVKNDGILITLGTPQGDDREVQVGINGFVACLGATWLTYVVRHEAGTGWRVTGTTGPAAVA